MQLLGVLREVVAGATPGRRPTSASSLLFETPTVTDEPQWPGPAARPARRRRPIPQAGWLRPVSAEDPAQRLAAAVGTPSVSAEVLLAAGGRRSRPDGPTWSRPRA